MADYRVYLLRADRKIVTAREISCADDEEATARARRLRGEFAGVEIWCGRRLVRASEMAFPDAGP